MSKSLCYAGHKLRLNLCRIQSIFICGSETSQDEYVIKQTKIDTNFSNMDTKATRCRKKISI